MCGSSPEPHSRVSACGDCIVLFNKLHDSGQQRRCHVREAVLRNPKEVDLAAAGINDRATQTRGAWDPHPSLKIRGSLDGGKKARKQENPL